MNKDFPFVSERQVLQPALIDAGMPDLAAICGDEHTSHSGADMGATRALVQSLGLVPMAVSCTDEVRGSHIARTWRMTSPTGAWSGAVRAAYRVAGQIIAAMSGIGRSPDIHTPYTASARYHADFAGGRERMARDQRRIDAAVEHAKAVWLPLLSQAVRDLAIGNTWLRQDGVHMDLLTDAPIRDYYGDIVRGCAPVGCAAMTESRNVKTAGARP